MAETRNSWDAELYEARHGFVWQFGEDVVELLDPKPGERILDLGCGTGHLTQKIAASGAEAIGLDASPEMIGQARQNYPRLQFRLADAARMEFADEFHAVFSNAALHWMLDSSGVAARIARALRTGGRFVAELGGKGNIQQIEAAIRATVMKYNGGSSPAERTFFPSVGEYSALLEAYGLEVLAARLFDRPTPLQGETGMEIWIRQFKWFEFETISGPQREKALKETVEALRPALFRGGVWYADYRRLRVAALKVERSGPGPLL